MRILHTSDWHLGQHFMGKSRQAEHQAFCAWLLEQVRTHEVDVLLIAGDVFDTGAPPSYAREQYYRLVVDLRDAGCALVVLGGNHDSPAMLGESRSLLAQLGTQVVPGVGLEPAEQVLVLPDRAGVPGAILCAIPFIRPREVMASQAGQSAQDKQRSLQQAIAEATYAVRLAPRVPVYRYQLGRLWLAAGDPRRAASYLDQALRLRGSFAAARRDRAWAHLLLGDQRGSLSL